MRTEEEWVRIAGSIIDKVQMTGEDYVNEELVKQLKRYFDKPSVQRAEGSRPTTLAGQTKDWWDAQIESIFNLARAGEDIPFGVLYVDLNWKPTEKEMARMKKIADSIPDDTE